MLPHLFSIEIFYELLIYITNVINIPLSYYFLLPISSLYIPLHRQLMVVSIQIKFHWSEYKLLFPD